MRLSSLSVVLSLSLATAASAQMAVHVIAGVVKSADHGEMAVASDNGTTMNKFHLSEKTPSLNFDSDLHAASSPAFHYDKVGDSVLLYYYGLDNDETAVAVRDLGSDAYTKSIGVVTAFDKHTRKLSLKDDNGKELSLTLDPALVVDTDMGVQSGKKFAPRKGDHVRVIYGGTNSDVVLLGEML